MKKLFIITALVSVFLGSFAFSNPATARDFVAPQTAARPDGASESAKVDALLAPFNQPNTPGVAVLVLRDGQTTYEKGHGLARLDTKEPVTSKTAFDLASTSKPFTAMAIMILAERGKLSFEDPLSKFFPEFPAYAQKVAVQHLLTHTSGLPDVINASWFKPDYVPTSKQIAAFLIKETTPRAAPGDRFEYNNSAYLLLSLIVEKVSGKSFAAFMHENIFKPLGMNNSQIWDQSAPQVQHLAISYAPAAGGFQAITPVSDQFVYGAKGVISTIDDLGKWIRAIEGPKLVKAETLQIAWKPAKLNDGSLSPYGFGWGLGTHNGLPMIEHPGGYLGFRTNIRIYPTEGTAIAVLSNNAQADIQTLTRSIARIYLGHKMAAPQAKVRVDTALLNSYAGKYQSDSAIAPNLSIEITLENGELFIMSPLGPKAKLLAQSQNEFTIGESTATVTFNREENSVKGLTLKTRMGIIKARRVN